MSKESNVRKTFFPLSSLETASSILRSEYAAADAPVLDISATPARNSITIHIGEEHYVIFPFQYEDGGQLYIHNRSRHV
jgi:hypothetical protein